MNKKTFGNNIKKMRTSGSTKRTTTSGTSLLALKEDAIFDPYIIYKHYRVIILVIILMCA